MQILQKGLGQIKSRQRQTRFRSYLIYLVSVSFAVEYICAFVRICIFLINALTGCLFGEDMLYFKLLVRESYVGSILSA